MGGVTRILRQVSSQLNEPTRTELGKSIESIESIETIENRQNMESWYQKFGKYLCSVFRVSNVR